MRHGFSSGLIAASSLSMLCEMMSIYLVTC
jgi:hypothetical protein